MAKRQFSLRSLFVLTAWAAVGAFAGTQPRFVTKAIAAIPAALFGAAVGATFGSAFGRDKIDLAIGASLGMLLGVGIWLLLPEVQ